MVIEVKVAEVEIWKVKVRMTSGDGSWQGAGDNKGVGVLDGLVGRR